MSETDDCNLPVSKPPVDLEGVRDRNPEALDAFFGQHFDRVYSTVYRLVGDVVTAQDISQEVFYRIHRAAHQIDPRRDPRPWVTAIAYNACREFWRSGAHKMWRSSVSVDENPLPLAAAENPVQDLLAREREAAVQKAILSLPEMLRAVVVLHDYEGLGHEQISQILGISHAAARKRYSRALAELAERLKDFLE